MSKKGLDSLFVHYGIRKDGMQTIEAMCAEFEIDMAWTPEDKKSIPKK